MTGYAGDVDPLDAWRMLQEDRSARLVDVRTQPEWLLVGVPDLSGLGRELIRISWQTWPGAAVNSQFGEELQKSGAQITDKIFFLCRSGGRSAAAARAATGLGYRFCYNVTSGFEGPLDGQRHRATVAGWKHAGLPWIQE